MIDEKRLTEIEGRIAKATTGPWSFRAGNYGADSVLAPSGHQVVSGSPSDCQFIASARQDILDLLSEVRRLGETKKRRENEQKGR